MIDVAIIGCGIIGAATAYELSKYQLSTAIFEQENDVSLGTTKANSAILHAGYDPEPGTWMAKLNVEGVKLAEVLCRELDVPYRKCGSFVLAFSEEEIPHLKQLYEKGVQNGAEGLKLLNQEELHQLEPSINPEACMALYAPSAAIVSPWEYALALAETAIQNGAALYLEHKIQSIDKLEDGYMLHTSKGDYQARYVINAAGVHADTIHNMVADVDFKIIPDRGEYYLLDKSEGQQVSHIIFQCPTKIGKGTLIAPTVHGNLIVGPNNESPDDRDDTATTSTGLATVAQMARKSVPGVNLRQSIRNFAGIRAASDKDDFVIQEAVKGFIDLAGIKSPGLSAAPAIAKQAIILLEKSGLSMQKKTDFLQTRKRVRFQELSPAQKAELIQKEPAYGRVICRCETITEGEILASLQSPIPPCSVDGVKRRCNAGMGRCQGGFCGPRVVEILARERKVPMTEILQDKAGTVILTGETKGGKSHV